MTTPAAPQQEGLLNRYAVSDELGTGRFGRSVLATDTKTSNLCSLKYINAPLCDGTSAILNCYLRIKHPNILRHLAFVANHRRSATAVADTTVMVSEYAGFGSLKHEIGRRRALLLESGSTKEVCGAAASETSEYGVLSSCEGAAASLQSRSSSTESVITAFEDTSPGIYFGVVDIWFITIQLLLGIRHLHKQKEVHRDITVQNIFINEPDRLVKLGHCHAFDYEVDLSIQPPELALTSEARSPRGNTRSAGCRTLKHWKEPSDIWALGCVLYELLTLRSPQEGWELTLHSHLSRYLNDEWAAKFANILAACLNKDPIKRASISSLVSMREVLEGYHFLVISRKMTEEPKLKHLLYYWDKSASKKMKLRGIEPISYIPKPFGPEGKADILTHSMSLEDQILSPGRTLAAHEPAGDKGAQLLHRMRSGRSYKLPSLGIATPTSGPFASPPAEYRMLSRSSIRRSLSQEARDKFSRGDNRIMAARLLTQHAGATALSARGKNSELSPKDRDRGNTEIDRRAHRKTIASEATTPLKADRHVLRSLKSTSVEAERIGQGDKLRIGEPLAKTITRETTPSASVRLDSASRFSIESPGDYKQQINPLMTFVDDHYEIRIPREDRLTIWRDVQSRAKEYSQIEAAMRACVQVLQESLARRDELGPDSADELIIPDVLRQAKSLPPSEILSRRQHATLTPVIGLNGGMTPNSKSHVDSPSIRLRQSETAHASSSKITHAAEILETKHCGELPERTHSHFTKSVQKAFDLVRITSADGTGRADCRRTIGRVSLFQQGVSINPAMGLSGWTADTSEFNFLSLSAGGRYRSASHEHY